MATEVERLVVSLEASITKYERSMQRALGQTNSTARKIEQRFASLNSKLQSGFQGVGRGIATAFAGAAALRGAQQLIDASTRVQNSLKVAGLEGEALTQVYDSLFASAQRNAAPVESLVELFGRAAIVQNELGVSTQELLGFTDNVAVALRVAGTDAASASGALLQLSQALGAGTVRAEEFNSILEGALPIAQAAAAGLEEAGGSVAKLRALVVDGKVSSEAFFRAFEAGSVILQEKVANSELTVSQSFIRLQNVLIDTAGKFDNASGASERVAGFLQQLATAIEGAGTAAEANAPAVNRFLDFISNAGNSFGDSLLANTGREFEQIAGAVESVAGSIDRYGTSLTDAELATEQAEAALSAFTLNGTKGFGELKPVVDDLIKQLLEGRGNADMAAFAIAKIGAEGDFGPLIGRLSGLVAKLFEVRQAGIAAAQAASFGALGISAPTMSETRAEQNMSRPRTQPPAPPKPITLANYPVGGGGGGGSGSGGSGGGGGTSPEDRFKDALKDQQQRLDEMNREIELRRQLGAAFDENGLAMEKLRVQLDLENEAARAGLELTPARKAAIDQMATAYAATAVELDRVTQAQEDMQQAAEDAAQALQDGVRGFIDDLIEGKSATEALGNALNSIGSRLLDLGLNSLFGGGGGFLGGLFGGKGFASGTANTGGQKGQARGIVHGQEAVIPLPNGGRVPVDLRIPSAPAMAGGKTVIMNQNISLAGAMSKEDVADIAKGFADQSVKQVKKSLPTWTIEHSQRGIG